MLTIAPTPPLPPNKPFMCVMVNNGMSLVDAIPMLERMDNTGVLNRVSEYTLVGGISGWIMWAEQECH